MDNSVVLFIIIVFSVSLIGSLFVLLYVFSKKKRNAPKSQNITGHSQTTSTKLPYSKWWRFLIISWPLSCFAFAGVIFYQALHQMPNRDFSDLIFVFVALIFFFIEMGSCHKAADRKQQATSTVVATVIDVVRRSKSSHSSVDTYDTQYEFYAEGSTHKVHSKFSSNSHTCPIKKGQEITLYYAPGQPHIIYVPEEVKSARFGVLLIGVGILFPLIALAAPWIRLMLK